MEWRLIIEVKETLHLNVDYNKYSCSSNCKHSSSDYITPFNANKLIKHKTVKYLQLKKITIWAVMMWFYYVKYWTLKYFELVLGNGFPQNQNVRTNDYYLFFYNLLSQGCVFSMLTMLDMLTTTWLLRLAVFLKQ